MFFYHNRISPISLKVVVLKLNGGLGTSMGLDKAKSLLEVKGNALLTVQVQFGMIPKCFVV